MNHSTTKTSKKAQTTKQKNKPGFRLIARDIEIIRAVYEYRVLDTLQIQKLFFSDNTTGVQCRLRLRHLTKNGYLHSQEQLTLLSEGNKPKANFLNSKGAELLVEMLEIEQKELDWRPREWEVGSQFLHHLLKTNDIRIQFILSAHKNGFTIQNWLDDRSLRRFLVEDTVFITNPKGAKEKAAAIADGHLTLVTPRRPYHLSLETDLRTVTGNASGLAKNDRDWARRINVVLEYYHSGKYEKRYNSTSMRWLTVTTGEKRLENLKKITEDSNGKVRFWFTTFDRISQGDIIIDPLWSIAGREGVYPLID